ncbi:hypothetical protein NPIL_586841, partial [Nephila pilipes]
MSLISLFDLNTLLIPFSQLCHLIAVLFVKSSESAPIPFNMSLDDLWMNPYDIVHYFTSRFYTLIMSTHLAHKSC